MAPLLGPPEIRQAAASGTGTSEPESGDPFMDLMTSQFNAVKPTLKPPMGFTQNHSPTFLSSGDACLDFFFQILPDTPTEILHTMLHSAWEHDPLSTLKLICHLRAVRGTGKSDKESFYTAALWLHNHHPKTLALNIKHISRFGYLKDMPELLFRLHAGNDVRKIAKKERLAKLRQRKKLRKQRKRQIKNLENKSVVQKILSWDPDTQGKTSPEMARELSKKKVVDLAKRAVERYNRDSDYRFLHAKISELFAELLLSDLRSLRSGEQRQIGLAAKWCPSPDSSYDKYTLLCESIARRVFPRESDPEYGRIEEAHYAYRVRDRLRKEVLVPLRRVLELPEVFMSAKQWDTLPYTRIASVAMKNYKAHFLKHDRRRFHEFLGRVKGGSAKFKRVESGRTKHDQDHEPKHDPDRSARRWTRKIAAGALLPHEILAEAESEVADLQWKRMVSDMSEKGKLKNCLAVCDVSGGMRRTPVEVCLAMGMLVSDLSEDPWKGKIISFSENPQIHRIEGETLKEKINFLKRMEWGKNTNFQKVFDQILEIATKGKLGEEKMIKRVFVFSSMEFDKAAANPWETDYEVIKRKFRECGYSGPPEMVFWNLRDSSSTPVTREEKGVAMVGGFSKNLLKVLMEEGRVLSPAEVMEAAISGDEYKELLVFD